MDFATIKASGRVIDVRHPGNGEQTGLKITLLPPHDPAVEAASRKVINRRINSRRKRHNIEVYEGDTLEILIAAVADWEWGGEATFRGARPECTPENVREVLTEVKWLRKVLQDEMDNESDFFDMP